MTKSIIPPTGDHGLAWPSKFVLPQGKEGAISYGGWTKDNEGFVQQTFLGASIRNFDLNAGFGDTTSSLSVSVVEDEFNKSDGTGQSQGDDVYHNGGRDIFNPPIVGSPVFFKFGKNLADVEQAWRKTFDDTYGYNTLSLPITFPTTNTTGPITAIPADHHFLKKKTGTGSSQVNEWEDKSIMYDTANPDMRRGYAHFVFGGILQSYTQNRGPGGNPAYNISVQDPREILSNATMLLNNYAGTTYNNKNLFNLYGFLEYDVSDSLKAAIDAGRESKSVLKKSVDQISGEVSYAGIISDTSIALDGTVSAYNPDLYKFPDYLVFSLNNYPPTFPITGQGFARRSDLGIPIYRVFQAMETLFEMNGNLPDEIKEKGFGGAIDFRGFKYVVDWTGIPVEKIPNMYFMDFDQIDMLSFAQELCDIISHDMLVSLLPVIDHPGCQWLHQKNQYHISIGEYSKVIAGIIRIDTIDKSKQPAYGAIKEYLDDLESRDIYVENRDVGYEVSNVTTDKFVVGAQEVEMYYFTNNRNRDNLQLRRKNNGLPNNFEQLQRDQWSLDTMLQQQILPFYGFLGKKAVTIPRGFGAYQQIMLDSSNLDAFGVGNYYIATEMEMRAAMVSYEKWRDFLLLYDENYIEELGDNKVFLAALAGTQTDPTAGFNTGYKDLNNMGKLENREFGVSVPRCVFNSDRDYMGSDGYPASPCAPPFGYPLYYKRAEKIGIPQAGLVSVGSNHTRVITNFERIENATDDAQTWLRTNGKNVEALIQDLNDIEASATYGAGGPTDYDLGKEVGKQAQILQDKMNEIKDLASSSGEKLAQMEGFIERPDVKSFMKLLPKLAKQYQANARKVYEFVKDVANTHLGKKFLIKIPKSCNLNYDKTIALHNNDSNLMQYSQGPFGFKPEPVSSGIDFRNSTDFFAEITNIRTLIGPNLNSSSYEHYLDFKNIKEGTITPPGLFLPALPSLPHGPKKYTYGALKGNFNPISEKWEFNYNPEPQGGFFNFALYDKNLSFMESQSVPNNALPPVTQQLLAPRDLTNFVDENGRTSCYVRYDNSQFIDFGGVSKDSLTQQELDGVGGFIPDIMSEMDNLNPDKSESIDKIQERLSHDTTNNRPKESVAYVKCSVEPEFYMAPKIRQVNTRVFARRYKFVPHVADMGLVEKRDADGCVKMVPVQGYAQPVFTVENGGSDGTFVQNQDFERRYNGQVDGEIVNTDLEQLDPDSVYAIITVPGRVVPTVDSRYLDGPYQAFNAPQIKNMLTADVVKGVIGFEQPVPATNTTTDLSALCDKLTVGDLNNALLLDRDYKKGLALDLPEGSLAMASPSPVYPDLVALPLMSMEKCYGPWQSASVQNFTGSTQVRYSNIGGKIEFVKDEGLAPWNYAGYQLMNEAGQLQAQFSNSLLLFTERGGFVMPEAPTGISLAKALKQGGPLVTSVSVSIGDSVKTTVKMDLYTSRFGKLQKQKEDAIGKAARERQKAIDMKNQMTRKGLTKGASSRNLLVQGGMFDQIADAAKSSSAQLDRFSQLEKGQTVHNNYVVSATPVERESRDLTGSYNGAPVEDRGVVYGASMQAPGYLEEALQNVEDPDVAYQQLAGGSLPFVGYNQQPGDNAYFPSVTAPDTRAINERTGMA